MEEFKSLGRILILFGGILLGAGLLIYFSGAFSYLGRLPGDITIKREGFTFYFPITTGILLSILLSLILYLFRR